MLDFPGPWTGSSSSTHPPTGQPVRHATFNTTLPTGQSALRCVTPPVWPPLAASAAQPTQGHPANWPRPPPPLAGAPPKESPCGTTVQPAGCLAWAIPPRRGPRPPPARAGEVHNRPRDTAMPPSSPCLDSTCMPASRGAHCAPTPRARASSSLPGPSSPVLPLYILSNPIREQNGKSGVKVYKKVSKNALHYGPGPSFWTAQFSADLEEKKGEAQNT
jgi:hypothetical protein